MTWTTELNSHAVNKAVLFLTILPIATAGLSWLLQFCYQHTPGFRLYYRWLRSISIYRKRYRDLTMPLGTCVYCQGIWIALILNLFVLMIIDWPGLGAFGVVMYIMNIGTTYLCLEGAKYLIKN